MIAEVLLAVAIFGFIGYVASSIDSTLAGFAQLNFAPRAPSQASWRPDSSVYCTSLQNLNLNQSGAFVSELSVDQIADAAPTSTAHNTAVVLYSDVSKLRPTINDLNALVAAYPCPAR